MLLTEEFLGGSRSLKQSLNSTYFSCLSIGNRYIGRLTLLGVIRVVHSNGKALRQGTQYLTLIRTITAPVAEPRPSQ